ncbi:hypothetical protein D3C71_1508820 [compost metagenome]
MCSDSSCRPTAVDDSASAVPITSALFQWKWYISSRPPSTLAVSSTCTLPPPNTGRRITINRDGDNSRPIRNSSITTPISAALRMRSASCTKPSTCGPSATPAAR